DIPALDKNYKHNIDVVVDRLIVKPDIGNRIADSLEIALQLTDGIAVAEMADKSPTPETSKAQAKTAKGKTATTKKNVKSAEQTEQAEQIIFSARFACPVSGFTIDEIEPRLFSFNNPFGACPAGDGLGTQYFINPEAIVPNPNLSLKDGAIAAWSKGGTASPYFMQTLESLARHYKFSMSKPWHALTASTKKAILYGSGDTAITLTYSDGTRSFRTKKQFEGVIGNLERRYRETDSARIMEEIEKYHSITICDKCDGNRLKSEALAVKIGGCHIGEITHMSIQEADIWFKQLDKKLNKKQKEIAARILKEIRTRLKFLNDVGLDYLTLSRDSGSLSGGESQRIRLASQIGSGLTGVLYVLDEPSIGLHQRDNARLLETLEHLRNLGNTVIMVEHDEEAIWAADHVVDIGPGAGLHGGEIIATGTAEKISKAKKSLTGQYLSGVMEIPIPTSRRPATGRTLKVIGARGNNLKNINADIPLGTLTCVTGVSGGGKSTLLIDTLYRAAARYLHHARALPATHKEIKGLSHIDKVIDINQSPIGRTPRSNPATYTGAFTPIREWFANLPEARVRGYKPGRFSFNVKGGRCETCQGDGVIKIEMHFLPDVYVECDTCHGKRYNRETLEVRFKDKNIADILDMTVEEASAFFRAVPSVREKMEKLERVGLGYIKVGQQATTLSGGEAQRVKLAKELAKRATGRTLYILDEPTTGLHFHDVAKLLEVLHEIVDGGNTVIVIEHNLEVIKTADWIIDLGPEGGDGGGEIVACGTPEQTAKCQASYTGQYLARLFRTRKTRSPKQIKARAPKQIGGRTIKQIKRRTNRKTNRPTPRKAAE
ncbi:MAG: excinuclease ABC subunit UvrA, partial [Alphaproteobacteria bacterium]|nr:excinuclease ABC subunit UvrA [Alphaproteobacteria bacterium]